jgi:peptidoglycan/LPS O-acetylase OafA/YrhL
MAQLASPVPVVSASVDKRYPWIDVLRGIAILMVIAVHASHGLKDSDSLVKAVFGFGGYFDEVRDVGSRLLSKKSSRSLRFSPSPS